jgi:hypothetical protein
MKPFTLFLLSLLGLSLFTGRSEAGWGTKNYGGGSYREACGWQTWNLDEHCVHLKGPDVDLWVAYYLNYSHQNPGYDQVYPVWGHGHTYVTPSIQWAVPTNVNVPQGPGYYE